MNKFRFGLAAIAFAAAGINGAQAASINNVASGSVAVVGADCCKAGQVFPNIILDAANNRSNYLVFDVGPLAAMLGGKDAKSVTLTLNQPGFYSSADATETFTLWDFTGNVNALKNYSFANPPSAADAASIRDDLRSGISYGSAVIAKPVGALSILTIMLNDDAVAAINSALNSADHLFAIGGFSSTLTGSQLLFQSSTGSASLDVTPVPGPVVGAGLPGLIAACAGLLAWRRRRLAANA